MDFTFAYIAGIIDGEGSIMLSREQMNQHPSPVLAVDSTDRELLDWLKSTCGGNIVVKKKMEDHHSQAWTWRLRYRAVIDLLRVVRPFMKINRKRERARILVEGYHACTPRNGKYTSAMLQAKQELYERFRAV